jgi:hypothetical protein
VRQIRRAHHGSSADSLRLIGRARHFIPSTARTGAPILPNTRLRHPAAGCRRFDDVKNRKRKAALEEGRRWSAERPRKTRGPVQGNADRRRPRERRNPGLVITRRGGSPRRLGRSAPRE